jgi:hypothetical protein
LCRGKGRASAPSVFDRLEADLDVKRFTLATLADALVTIEAKTNFQEGTRIGGERPNPRTGFRSPRDRIRGLGVHRLDRQ